MNHNNKHIEPFFPFFPLFPIALFTKGGRSWFKNIPIIGSLIPEEGQAQTYSMISSSSCCCLIIIFVIIMVFMGMSQQQPQYY
jgi:hypothetical protein